MIVLGLTGSIGMGKSTTAQMFRDLGIPVYDADAEVHRLYDTDGRAVEPIREIFPDAIIGGKVDRGILGQAVLGDDAAIRKLEAVVHPLVGQSRQEFFERATEARADIVVLDIPLLFETGGHKAVDVVVVVTAAPEVQKARVLDRSGMTPEKFEAVLARQVPDGDKRLKADYLIETDHGMESARQSVNQLVARLRTGGVDAVKNGTRKQD